MTLPPAPAPPRLPASEQVDVRLLAEAFTSFTTSYKFLLLKAILHGVQRHGNDPAPLTLSAAEIRREMLVNAWFPCRRFRLGFGHEDRVASIFEHLEACGFLRDEIRISAEKIRGHMRENAAAIDPNPDVRRLSWYPLYVMLLPWFKDLRRLSNPRAQVVERSVAVFDGPSPPPYKIERIQGEEAITVNPKWRAYLSQNMHIVEGWLDSKWLRFLESRNPNAPALSSKLWDRPSQRQALDKQRGYWDAYLGQHPLRCIYSRQPVSRPYALDHFLPWTWIGHDQLWNLIPVSQSVNSDKGDRLPADELVASLADAHFQALAFAFRAKPPGWKKRLDDYRFGLRASDEVLQDAGRLRNAYAGTVEPLLALARRQGFVDWSGNSQNVELLKG